MPIRILSESDIFLRVRKKVKTQILYLLGGLGVVAAGFELTLAVGSIPAQKIVFGIVPTNVRVPYILTVPNLNICRTLPISAMFQITFYPVLRIRIRLRIN